MKRLISLKKLFQQGGPGSGHHGHRGIPGEQGGSLPDKGSAPSKKTTRAEGDVARHRLENPEDYAPGDIAVETYAERHSRGIGRNTTEKELLRILDKPVSTAEDRKIFEAAKAEYLRRVRKQEKGLSKRRQ